MRKTVALVLAVSFFAAVHSTQAQQCDAPQQWFPHANTPPPDFHQPTSECDFHLWAWQEFLWLTQSTGPGRIRLLDMPMADDLFTPGLPPRVAAARPRRQVLVLKARGEKREGLTHFGDFRQALSRGVIVDQQGRAVYYASQVSPEFFDFIRQNNLFEMQGYLNASPTLNFPVRSVEFKSSWRIVSPGEDTSGFFTTSAVINPLVCTAGGQNCQGDDIVIDRNQTLTVQVALVGLHVVGVVEGHPEFIWSTFEHIRNAPDLADPSKASSPDPVSHENWTFYKADTPAIACNLSNSGSVRLTNQSSQTLSPPTNIFRQFPFGGGDAQDLGNIKALNKSVHAQLEQNSVWQNYQLIGGVWFKPGADLTPGLSGPAILNRTTGSVRLSNATMETFDQNDQRNCFACHNTRSQPVDTPVLPPKNLNLSHILINGLIQRREAQAMRVARSAAAAPLKPLNSFKDVQNLMNQFVQANDVPISRAPHKDFWNIMSYADFTTGDIPRVTDPATGNPLKVLIKKDSSHSSFIMALRGVGPLFDPNNGTIGQMPVGGPFMTDQDINRIADWIDRDCPN